MSYSGSGKNMQDFKAQNAAYYGEQSNGQKVSSHEFDSKNGNFDSALAQYQNNYYKQPAFGGEAQLQKSGGSGSTDYKALAKQYEEEIKWLRSKHTQMMDELMGTVQHQKSDLKKQHKIIEALTGEVRRLKRSNKSSGDQDDDNEKENENDEIGMQVAKLSSNKMDQGYVKELEGKLKHFEEGEHMNYITHLEEKVDKMDQAIKQLRETDKEESLHQDNCFLHMELKKQVSIIQYLQKKVVELGGEEALQIEQQEAPQHFQKWQKPQQKQLGPSQHDQYKQQQAPPQYGMGHQKQPDYGKHYQAPPQHMGMQQQSSQQQHYSRQPPPSFMMETPQQPRGPPLVGGMSNEVNDLIKQSNLLMQQVNGKK